MFNFKQYKTMKKRYIKPTIYSYEISSNPVMIGISGDPSDASGSHQAKDIIFDLDEELLF